MHTLQITFNQVLKQCCGIIKFCRKDHGGNDVRLVTCLDVSRSPIAIKNRRFYFSLLTGNTADVSMQAMHIEGFAIPGSHHQ